VALLLTVAGSAVFFFALVPAARFGLSRMERTLKAEHLDHWKDGESSAKAAERHALGTRTMVLTDTVLRSTSRS
jgi:hypothetical protein